MNKKIKKEKKVEKSICLTSKAGSRLAVLSVLNMSLLHHSIHT